MIQLSKESLEQIQNARGLAEESLMEYIKAINKLEFIGRKGKIGKIAPLDLQIFDIIA